MYTVPFSIKQEADCSIYCTIGGIKGDHPSGIHNIILSSVFNHWWTTHSQFHSLTMTGSSNTTSCVCFRPLDERFAKACMCLRESGMSMVQTFCFWTLTKSIPFQALSKMHKEKHHRYIRTRSSSPAFSFWTTNTTIICLCGVISYRTGTYKCSWLLAVVFVVCSSSTFLAQMTTTTGDAAVSFHGC